MATKPPAVAKQDDKKLPFGKVTMYSNKFYGLCGLGGIVACGSTHTLLTPVDLVKCRKQTGWPYKGVFDGFRQIAKADGAFGLVRGWVPTLAGYSAQGMCKFGFYEFFKHYYSTFVTEDSFYRYRTFFYIGASASAELIADVALCPFEATKVRVQTDPKFGKGLMDAMPKIIKNEGFGGLYKGLVPLWCRQVPYTIMKFTSFERTVEAIYKYALSHPKDHYTKAQQLGVSFAGGYIAGVLCALVSHPADVVVSKLNKTPGATIGGIVKKLGFKGCWEGLVARIFMVGTLTALQWFLFDAFKVYCGIPTTGVSKPKSHDEKKPAIVKPEPSKK